jgi:acyl-CoA synthetase (AMP-forming)/AMP-acid ligase II
MNIGRLITDAASHRGDQIAFVYGDQVTRYREAGIRTQALAYSLAKLGLERGDRVAVLLWNCPQLLESYFATWQAGGCVVPLNARFRADEVAYHVEDSDAQVVIFGQAFRELIEEVALRLPSKRLICVGKPLSGQIAYDDLLQTYWGCSPHEVEISDDDPAWLFYTSGTTGQPKGAMLSHENLTFVAVGWLADLMPLEPDDVGIHAAPLTHGAGFHALALTMRGCTQIIPRSPRFDLAAFCSAVQEYRVTNTWMVPTQIKMLLRYPELGKWDLSSLRWVVHGGAPMYVADLEEAVRRLGSIFVQVYGQGETPMTITYLPRKEHVLEGPESKRLLSCGRVRSGMEVRILDSEDRELSRGQQGEICVRGPAVMKGYWRRPEDTAKTLRHGWLHTGDLGSMDDHGYVYILDRSKDMIISGGENVYPREVEEVLIRHPSISEVCVFGVPDELWGEAVKALVVLKPGFPATEEEILAFTHQRIAGYKNPKSIEFVPELPRNPYGKIMRREIRDRYWVGRVRHV